jgi:methylenetetrahydrofolate--tRNA-(uracil-5-)-methyltransferase
VRDPLISVIGAGLAGSEAAWQIAEAGLRVRLYEMKLQRKSPAHHSDNFAELVCSNSFRSDRIENAVGLLKEELRKMGSLIMSCADRTKVPAGGALAVDREDFSSLVTESIKNHPLIEIVSEEVSSIPSEGTVIIATGPLTDGELASSIMSILGNSEFHFFDAAAPIVLSNSIDRSIAFPMSRYGKGGDDYLNCPMNEEEYRLFYEALVTAELAEVANFDKETVFEGCMPIETMAKRGYDTIRFGPMKPVGLIDPRIGKEPYACVQLRQDDRLASMFNIVGFQTRLRIPEQQRVFRMIPGLRDAEFCRYGVMHRNTFINSPQILDSHYSLKNDPRIYFAGQITGVEGYVESVGSGFLAGIYAAAVIKELSIENPLSDNTMIGAMAAYVSDPAVKKFQPMNANFGIIAPLGRKFKSKPEKNLMYAERSQEEIDRFIPVISALREKGYN